MPVPSVLCFCSEYDCGTLRWPGDERAAAGGLSADEVGGTGGDFAGRKVRGVHGRALRPAGAALAAVVGDGCGLGQIDADRRGERRVGSPVWSPDSRWIAYDGAAEGKHGLAVVHPDGSSATFLTEASGTNAPLPGTGAEVTWSPDSKQIAFISATPGPETADATGDPIVITRYMYKPDAGEGMTRFNDNRRLHIFIVDVATKAVRQVTNGR